MLTAFQMPTEEQGRPKRARKMSRKQKRALGLASDSESDSSSIHEDIPGGDSEEEEEGLDSGEDDRPPTDNTSQVTVNTPALTLPHSQSTTSIISQVPASRSTSQADDMEDKRTKFDERFQTATSTDEEVLRMSLIF